MTHKPEPPNDNPEMPNTPSEAPDCPVSPSNAITRPNNRTKKGEHSARPGIRPKGGAPIGNTNGMTNGSRIHRLSLGVLPAKLSRVTRYCQEYRRGLEAVVAENNDGNVTMSQAHFIDSACTHEQHGQICRWLLRQRMETMSTSDIRECSKQMATAKDQRNRAVERLGIDRDTAADAIEALYSIVPTEGDSPRNLDDK